MDDEFCSYNLRRKMLRDQMQQKFMESAEHRDFPKWLAKRRKVMITKLPFLHLFLDVVFKAFFRR